MAVPPTARPRGPALVRAGSVTVPLVAVLVLLAGATGLLAAATALAVGVGAAALWAGAVLVRTALAIHRADGTFVACRGAGYVGMAALVTGVTAALPLAAPPGAGIAATVGVGLVGVLYVLGTMLLPGAATSTPVRLRRAFDGLGLGVSLGFAAWLITPMDTGHPETLTAMLLTACAVAVVIVVALRARPHRRAAMGCGVGAVIVLVGLCTVTNMLSLGQGGIALPLLGVPIVAGLGLTAAGGSRRDLPAPKLEPREPDQYLAGYPLLALPAAVGVVAAVTHLIVVGVFDRIAVVLGLSMVGILTMRELLVVSDIRRYAGRLKIKEAHFRSLVAGATDLTLVLDERLVITWQSPAAARLFGLADAEVVGRTFADLLHPDDAAAAQAVIRSVLAGEHADGPPALVSARIRDGHRVWRDTESTISDQRSVPEVAALVVHVRDVGERKHLERALHRLSYTDQLTGAP